LAAIKRQKEKERLMPQEPECLVRERRVNEFEQRYYAEQDKKREKMLSEARFVKEFNWDVTKLRIEYLEAQLKLIKSSIAPESIGADTVPLVRLKAEDIIRYHAEKSDYTYNDIIGPRRQRKLVAVRQQAMVDVYVQCPHLSLPQIGRRFGGKDHTTILHAVVKLGIRKREYRSDKKAA